MDNHRFAEYIVNNKGYNFPTLDEIKNTTDGAEDVESVRERLKELERRHYDDLETLYHAQATSYLDEAKDRCLAKDELVYLVQGENNPTVKESYEKLDNMYRATRRTGVHMQEWDDQLYRVRMAYLNQMLPLRRKLAILESQQDSRDPRSRPGRSLYL